MIGDVKEDIIRVLIDAIGALKKKDFALLKDISNHTIHNASIFQDKDSVSIAVITFSLFKIFERLKEKEDHKDILPSFIKLLNDALTLLKKDMVSDYRRAVKATLHTISKTDDQLKMYIEEVIDQAQIKKGSKLYEHGISMARAADVLGISQWELMSYVGKTNIIDMEKEAFDIRDRVAFARSLFER